MSVVIAIAIRVGSKNVQFNFYNLRICRYLIGPSFMTSFKILIKLFFAGRKYLSSGVRELLRSFLRPRRDIHKREVMLWQR